MMDYLKPCPLCQSEARLGLTNSADEQSGYVRTYAVFCISCSCQIARTSETDKNGWSNEPDESVKHRVTLAWNTRHPSSPKGLEK